MPPVVLTLLQWVFLLLLYVFVARAVRAVIRDISPAALHQRPGRAGAVRLGPRAATRPAQRRARTPPRELVVHQPAGRPTVVPLAEGAILLGRDPSCTVPLSDSYASERHARVSRDGDGWVVTDLGSTNGTFVNQVKVTSPRPLAPGDQIGIGKTIVEVRK